MKKLVLASLALASLLASGAAMAQDAVAPVPGAAVSDIPGHPRVNEVDQRIDNQQERINQGVSDGKINAHQELKDENKLTGEENKLSADEAKNGGHITKKEQRHLNKGLNRNSKRIFRQKHKAPVAAPAAAQ